MPTDLPHPRSAGALLLTILPLTAMTLTGCGALVDAPTTPDAAANASARPATVAISATDDACTLSQASLRSGVTTLSITNAGSQVTEVYVYDGDRIVTEKENIGPGTSYDLTADLTAGDYQVACKPGMTGAGIRQVISVSGTATGLTPAEQRAVDDYRAYVQGQVDSAIPLVQQFRDAIAAGDRTAAQGLYATSRLPWESIEPVAESFGDLDPRMDARKADLQAGDDFTGWHRLEQALWTGEDLAPVVPVADQLLLDAQELSQRVRNAALTPASIGNGAKGLLDEVATRKITGEEEAFSHTDLMDVKGNLDGADTAFRILEPLVRASDPGLPAELTTRFAEAQAALVPHLDPAAVGGYVPYDTVPPEQRRALARAVDGLSEPLSQLGAAAAGTAL